MDNTVINISGIDEVEALLRNAPERLVRQAFRRALSAATVPVVQNLKPRIPERTGDLKQHLETKISIHADGLSGVARIGFGSEGWRARLVELGHRMIGHGPENKEIGEVSAHPFMGPAASASGDAAIEAFTDSMRDSLQVDNLRLAS